MYGDDDTHITGQITFEQIAEAIRHKKYGRDMREAIAQGLEYCMAQAQKVDKLEQDLSNLDKRLANLPNKVVGIEQDIGTINDEISKLNMAVFGDGAVPIDTQKDLSKQTNKAQEVHLD